jgi:hypothetical protein
MMTPFISKAITYGLPTILIIIAFIAIWTQSQIRWEMNIDAQGIKHFIYPGIQRNLAALIIIFSVFCIMTAGAIFTFEIAGKPEKSRALAATMLFQDTAIAAAGGR